MAEKYTGASSADEAPTYAGGWGEVAHSPTVALFIGGLSMEDMASLDYAFNLVDVNALYFESFYKEATDVDKSIMNTTLSELHLVDTESKRGLAKTIATLLEKY